MGTINEGSSLQHWSTPDDEMFILRLFIAGASTISMRAITNLRSILDDKLKGKYELEIIDIHQQPLLVKEENIFAVPLLIRKHPHPVKRLVGDMSDAQKVLRGLGLS